MRDLVGEKFGRLTVVSRADDITSSNGKQVRMWNCVCDCGGHKTAREVCLLYGKTMSCGCLYKETRRKHRAVKHGMARTRLYSEWNRMIQRCTNPRVDSYARYGGRGISVCQEWSEGFDSFYQWAILNNYTDDKTLDRIDYNGNYTPENCRWATFKQQANNKSSNKYITLNDTTKTLMEWCEDLNMPYQTVWRRLYRLGWSPEKALLTSVKRHSDKK